MLGNSIREHIGHVTIGLFSSAVLNELSEAKKNPDRVLKKEKSFKFSFLFYKL